MRNDSHERDSQNELRLITLLVNEVLLKTLSLTLEVSEMPSADLLTLWGSTNAFQKQLVRQRTFQSCPGPVGTAFESTSPKSHARIMANSVGFVTHNPSK